MSEDDSDERDPLSASWREVGEHYDQRVFDFEVTRLDEHRPLERDITLRFISRHAPKQGAAADVGVGAGHYAHHLAQRGLSVQLVDVSQRLLERAEQRLKEDGLGDLILGAHHTSATDLSAIQDATLDLVLVLGPLYHLPDLLDRQAAVSEAARVLKPGGLIFAAGINRLAYLRDLYLDAPERAAELIAFHERYLEQGSWQADATSPLYQAHLTTIEELRALMAKDFEEVALAGVESFVPHREQRRLLTMSAEAQRAWLDLVERTATWPEGLAQGDHFLFIGQRRVELEQL